MENYEILEKLGHGSFGKVWMAKSKKTGEIVAIKQIDYSHMNKKEKEMLVSEVNVLRKLNSPHVVSYKDRFVEKSNRVIYIVMEYCPFGDLQSIITRTRASSEKISEDRIWVIIGAITQALYDCHNSDEKVIHRDIKPANIFIDGKGRVKLGDFGLAKALTTDFAQSRVGTPYYMSPELVSGRGYDDKSDIWALGCVAYEMATLRPAFRTAVRCEEELYSKIKTHEVPRIPSMYSDALWSLIASMLEKDPRRRPSASDILKIPDVQVMMKLSAARQELKTIRDKRKLLHAKIEELDAREQKLITLEKRKAP